MNLKPLLHPEMKDDESSEGYLQRLIFINHRSFEAVSRYKQKLCNENFKSDYKLYRRFVEVMEMNWNDVEKNDFDYWRNQGLSFYNSEQKTRFCWECMKEEKYHRVDWIITPMIVCRKHKTLLLQNCSKCNKDTTIRNTVWGICINCGYSLTQTKFEQNHTKYDFVDWTRDINSATHSPFWQYNCDLPSFFKLVKWMMHHLIKYFPKNFTFELSENDKYNLPVSGRIKSLDNLYVLLQTSYYLLNDWPNNLLLFLKESVESCHKQKAYEFIATFFLRHKDPLLNKLLREVHKREWYLSQENYRSSYLREEKQLSKSHTIIDRNYLSVNDICSFIGFSKLQLKKYVDHFQYKIIEHPRNNQLYMSVTDLQTLLHRRTLSIKDIPLNTATKFISKEDLAQLWGIPEYAAEITSKILDLQSMQVFDERAFNKWEAEYQLDFVKTVITIEELASNSIWEKDSLKRYMYIHDVEEATGNRYNRVSSDKIILIREQALKAFDALSNDLDDYYTRRETLELLGLELFKVSYILPMYIQNGNIYYNKHEVHVVLEQFKEVKSTQAVRRLRNNQFLKMLAF